MRKFVSLLVGFSFALGINAENLIENPSFEGGIVPWQFINGGTIVNDNAHSGSKALRLSSEGGTQITLENVQPHTSYEVSGWLKSDDGKPVMMCVKESGDNEKKIVVTSTEYTYVSLKYTSGPTHHKALVCIFGQGGTGYADDISFTHHSDFEDNYTLIWSDEFNVDGVVDSNYWNYESGFARNKELQWYQQENAFCEDGLLVIEGRREKRENPTYVEGSNHWKKSREYINYTSSSVKTDGKFSFMYGRMEVRAKVTNLVGTWPAIWTLGNSCEWPSNGEVDVMENYGGKILGNFGWGSNSRWNAKWDGKFKMVTSLAPNWLDDFHIWQLVWDEDRMTIFFDDVMVNDVDLNTTINGTAKCEGQNPFRQEHYILLNLAIGGISGEPSDTAFPNRYLVDYVRVYQPKMEP